MTVFAGSDIFRASCARLGQSTAHRRSATRRHAVAEQVFTTNESPPSEPIPFHHGARRLLPGTCRTRILFLLGPEDAPPRSHSASEPSHGISRPPMSPQRRAEMALVASPPSRIAFFCELPPASGGETPLLHSAELYDRVAAELPEFTEKLISRGLQYSRVLSDGCALSVWHQLTFGGGALTQGSLGRPPLALRVPLMTPHAPPGTAGTTRPAHRGAAGSRPTLGGRTTGRRRRLLCGRLGAPARRVCDLARPTSLPERRAAP